MDQEMDLDINNYDLNDILRLFKMPTNFEEKHLKMAKQVVLKTHPDKSRLPANFFLFYSKAYKVLFEVYQFRNKSSNKSQPDTYVETISGDKEREVALSEFFKRNKELKETKNFNKWFNEQFEKNKVESEQEEGYGDWLVSNEDVEPERNISLSQMGEEIAKKKSQIRALVPKREIQDIYASPSVQGSLIGSSVPGECADFNSDLFGNLQYQDLRQAHTMSVIPVTDEDYAQVPKFNNVNEYTSYRNSQDVKPLSEKQAMDYLNKRSDLENNQASARAYALAKQTELAEKQNNDFWAGILKLTNK
jgi:hypothetical protein